MQEKLRTIIYITGSYRDPGPDWLPRVSSSPGARVKAEVRQPPIVRVRRETRVNVGV